MEEGLARDIVRGAGQATGAGGVVGGALRKAASMAAPAITGEAGIVGQAKDIGAATLQALGKSTPLQDLGFGAISGAGAEIGKDKAGTPGAIAGSILAPMSVAGGVQVVKGAAGGVKRLVDSFGQTVEGMSDDGAATLLSTMMVREGLSPDDVARELQRLGPDAVPADVGTNFARLLRLAKNKTPRIGGRVSKELGARQAGQGERLVGAFDDASGTPLLNLNDEVVRLDKLLGPEVKRLYKEAGSKPLRLSARLRAALESPDNDLGQAFSRSERRLANKRVAGDEITNIDKINATKQELDDRIGVAIREGRNNDVRDLTRLKNTMIDEVDQAVPEYKQARDAFAGKAELEKAGELGTDFFKIKARLMGDITKSMSDSEKRMFRLGAKQAIVDKLDSIQLSRDSVKALFGKGGDAQKLKAVFDTGKQFNTFMDELQKEAQFVLTRRIAQENSTTAQQVFDEEGMLKALGEVRRALFDPVEAANFLGRAVGGLSAKKASEANVRSLEKAGDLLLESGMNPDRIRAILRSGDAARIERVLREALPIDKPAKISVPGVAAGLDVGLEEIQQ